MSPLLVLLLASAGPLLVGFDIIGEHDDDDEEETPTPEPGEIVDVAAFIEDARGVAGDVGPVNSGRGTDAVDDFEGETDQSNAFDASGNDDTLTGGMLDDTLIGGEDSDRIAGGAGDDALFGGFQRATRPDDMDADTLSGGEGDDTLFMGNDDIATGGEGADVFVAVQDATGNVTVTDFDVDEDALAVETPTPDDLSVSGQAVTDAGLVITLSDGSTITLEGLVAEIDPAIVQFQQVQPLIT